MNTDRPALVTGATGYIAGWIVKRLLEEGMTVHAAVRDPSNRGKLAHLERLAATNPGALRFFKADLLDEGSYAEAMAGCSVVFHTASPFKLDVRDARRELVDPAREGTRNVLETANRTESIERVVLTSSTAAIYGDCADLDKTPGGIFTEDDWNTTSTLDHQPYAFSKTVAEREAWSIAGTQARWKLVVINPCLVIGPAIDPFATSESFTLVRQLGRGLMRLGVPELSFGVVDVRDVAQAHLQAAHLRNASGRHIILSENTSLLELARALRPRFERYPLPGHTLPTWLVWLVAPLARKSITRRYVALNIGRPWRADNGKSLRELGMRYRSPQASIQEMFQQMIDTGQIARRN